MSDRTAGKKPRIEIRKSWCKNCGICVEFCPQSVLQMKNGFPEVVQPEKCTVCQLCELRCPDFAIEVYDDAENS